MTNVCSTGRPELHPGTTAQRIAGVRLLLLSLGATLLASAAPPLTFTSMDGSFAAASGEYRQLWCSEGARIVAAMERVTGFPYPGGAVEVFVADVTPMTVRDGRTILLKASYPTYYKRATLVHELGHRLAFTMPRGAGLDDHRLLYLFLYDVWTDLYGRSFADTMVDIEQRIAGRYDYAAAWDWALVMTRTERQAQLALLREQAGAGAQPATAGDVTLPGCSNRPSEAKTPAHGRITSD